LFIHESTLTSRDPKSVLNMWIFLWIYFSNSSRWFWFCRKWKRYFQWRLYFSRLMWNCAGLGMFPHQA